MQVTDLKAILDYEHNEQWLAALNCYKGIWDHNPTDDVAIRYCFFCWYLIWQWEQIDFPGEDISFEAKITVDNRMGISKAELEHMLQARQHQRQIHIIILTFSMIIRDQMLGIV